MKITTVLAATLAVGLTAFAVHAEEKETPGKETLVDMLQTASTAPGLAKGAEPETKPAAKTQKKEAEGKRATGGRFGAIIARHAKANGIPLSLAHAVVSVESSYRPDVRGKAGEIGLMQIKPATARLMGYRGSVEGLFDPETNIKYGMKYLGKAHELGDGTTCGTILKYNAGHGAKRMNRISSAYCGKVKKLLAQN